MRNLVTVVIVLGLVLFCGVSKVDARSGFFFYHFMTSRLVNSYRSTFRKILMPLSSGLRSTRNIGNYAMVDSVLDPRRVECAAASL
jgi:hypothetical protein